MPFLDRRTFLTGTAGAATAVGLGAVLPADAAAQGLLDASGSTGLQGIAGPGLVGVQAPAGSTAAPVGEVRFALPGGWSDWQALPAADGDRDTATGAPAASGAVATPEGASGFEVRAPEGSQPVYAGVAAADAPAGGPQQYAGLPTVDCYGIPVVPRWAWGCDESIAFGGIEYRRAQVLTVHHSVTPAAWDPASTMRGFYRYHTITNGWGDIGYHLVIDPSGQVYQAHRTHSGYPVFAGPQPPGVTPDSVVAAHVAGTNSGNIGVCLMGNFDNGYPTPPAYAALVNVLAKLCNALSLDPLQAVDYWNPDGGWGRAAQAIQGHRDWMSTGCPGEQLYATLPQIRQATAYARNSGMMFPTSAGAPAVFYPGSTG